MQNEIRFKRLFGLVGLRLNHSFSQKYFRQKFINESINDAEFLNFEMKDLNEIKDLIINNPELEGFFVTIPYKEKIIDFLDEIDVSASNIGAVNLVKCIKGKSKVYLKGYNTDFLGFTGSLTPYLKGTEKNALVLGSGGASKAVQFSLLQLGLHVNVVSRKKHKHPFILTYNGVNETLLKSIDIIVNTTPLGMHPNIDTFPEIPYHLIKKGTLVFDLVYNPEKTEFLQKAENYGALILNGSEMLILQAEKGWEYLNIK